MRFFNREIHRQGMGTTVVVVLFTLLVLAFSVDRYMESSSSTAAAVLMNAVESSGLNPDEPPAQIEPLKGQTACPLGKRSPPTQLMPLPQ